MYLPIFFLIFTPLIFGDSENSITITENVNRPIPWHTVMLNFIKEKVENFIEIIKTFLGLQENKPIESVEENFENVNNGKIT